MRVSKTQVPQLDRWIRRKMPGHFCVKFLDRTTGGTLSKFFVELSTAFCVSIQRAQLRNLGKVLIFADCFHPEILRHISAQIIALNPQAASELAKRGIRASGTAPYFSNASHQMASRKSLAIADWVRNGILFTDDAGVSKTYQEVAAWYARFSANYCLWALEILSSAVQNHQPDEIIVYERAWVENSGPLLGWHETYMGSLAEEFGRKHSLKVRVVRRRAFKLALDAMGNRVKTNLRRAVSYWAARVFGRAYRRAIRDLEGRELILFMSPGAAMKRLVAQIKKERPLARCILARSWSGLGSFFLWLRQLPSAPFDAIIWTALLETPTSADRRSSRELSFSLGDISRRIGQEDLFSHAGVHFGFVVSRKLEGGIAQTLLWLHQSSACLEWLLRNAAPSLVISTGNQEEDILMGELCQKVSVPAIMISHGSYAHTEDSTAMREWKEHSGRLIRAPYPYTAAQTPLAQSFLEHYPPPGRVVRTGPLAWGTIADKKRGALLKKKWLDRSAASVLLVHAGTPKSHGSLRFHIYETMDEYVQSICELASAVNQMSEFCLVVRFRPFAELTAASLKTLVPFSDKVILSTGEPFSEVLGAADLLVSFSSTTIEEAILNQAPVLLYGCGGRYQHVPARQIGADRPFVKSAVYHVERAQDLESALINITRAHGQEIEPEFFRPYYYDSSQIESVAFLGKKV